MTGVQKGIKIAAIVLAIFIICIIINAILSVVGYFGLSSNTKDYSDTFSDINNIEIDLSSASIEIRNGTEFRIEASNVSDNFKVRERNGNLYIDEDNFWLWNNNGGEIILYIPSDLNELNIDTGAGETSISDITARNLELDMGAGILEINNSTFYESSIDGGTGTIDVTNSSLTDLELDCGVGDIKINGDILGRSSISAGVGEITLNLTGGESQYSLIVDKGLGNITINGTNFDNTTYGSGVNRIDIDGGIGNITVDF